MSDTAGAPNGVSHRLGAERIGTSVYELTGGDETPRPIFSTTHDPAIAVSPESGKIGVWPPGDASPAIISPVLRHALPALAPIVPGAAARLHLPRTLPGPRGVALTFDDGPHPEGTPAILTILARADVRAIFFLVGEQVERRPALAAEIVAAGHAVGLHGHRHRCQLRMTAGEIADDYRRGAATIEEATQCSPEFHRPPYGIYSEAGLRAARAGRLRPLLWSKWGRDWRRFTTPERIAARASTGVTEGDVILLHDADFYSSRYSHRRTSKALPLVIAELKRLELDTVLPA